MMLSQFFLFWLCKFIFVFKKIKRVRGGEIENQRKEKGAGENTRQNEEESNEREKREQWDGNRVEREKKGYIERKGKERVNGV